LIADMAIVPVIPSPLDLWASVGIRQVIENIRDINEEMMPFLMVNQCQPNTSLARETLQILPEYGIPVMDTKLHQRTVYRQSAVYGGTVHDLGSKASLAIKEIDSLAREVLNILHPKN
jgi:chromosome partitioning protein